MNYLSANIKKIYSEKKNILANLAAVSCPSLQHRYSQGTKTFRSPYDILTRL
jgi:hypothetical protein